MKSEERTHLRTLSCCDCPFPRSLTSVSCLLVPPSSAAQRTWTSACGPWPTNITTVQGGESEVSHFLFPWLLTFHINSTAFTADITAEFSAQRPPLQRSAQTTAAALCTETTTRALHTETTITVLCTDHSSSAPHRDRNCSAPHRDHNYSALHGPQQQHSAQRPQL